METFEKIITAINNVVWSNWLVYLCLAAGIYFSVRMRFPQFRLFKDMLHLIKAKPDTDKGITPFQSFAATVGSRVGMGNIAGVATAIYFGGPGAIFWMWTIALIGAASAFSETTLAQAYKRMSGDAYVGGAAHFISRGIKFRPLAWAFAIAAVLGPGLLMPSNQVAQIATTFKNAFGINAQIVAILTVVLIGLVVIGGIKRIGKVAELLAPIMCLIYVVLGIIIIGMNITKIPSVFGMIFSSAFGANALYGGIFGSALSWGVKRGVYSNEAGQGSGAIIAASAECTHPAKQGLVQAGSVYIDTVVVCTISAMIILLTGNYNVVDGEGNFITAMIPDIDYGISWAQMGIIGSFGAWAGKLLAIVVVLFVFTSLMGYYYQAESNIRFMCNDKPAGTWVFRVIFLAAVYFGVLVSNDVLWAMGDTGCGLMAWFNIIGILLLSNKAVKILKDYEKQKKEGKNPIFHPEQFGIDDPDGVWKAVAEDEARKAAEGRA